MQSDIASGILENVEVLKDPSEMRERTEPTQGREIQRLALALRRR